jgi:hypothetical protein
MGNSSVYALVPGQRSVNDLSTALMLTLLTLGCRNHATAIGSKISLPHPIAVWTIASRPVSRGRSCNPDCTTAQHRTGLSRLGTGCPSAEATAPGHFQFGIIYRSRRPRNRNCDSMTDNSIDTSSTI